MQNTRDPNDFVHAKILVMKKCCASREGGSQARKVAL